VKGKYDWDALRSEYAASDISAAAFAKKHGISPSLIYSHIKRENWSALREEYKKNSANDEDKLSREIDIADKLLGVLDDAVNDKTQFYRYIVKEKNGADSGEEERIFGKMDMQAFNNAIKALDSLQEIKRVMCGILSPEEESTEENETGVVILPEVEDEK